MRLTLPQQTPHGSGRVRPLSCVRGTGAPSQAVFVGGGCGALVVPVDVMAAGGALVVRDASGGPTGDVAIILESGRVSASSGTGGAGMSPLVFGPFLTKGLVGK